MSSFDITSAASSSTATHQLKDAEDNLLFTQEGDGRVPVTVTVHGPGSREYKQAEARRSSRQVQRLQKRGKIDISADERIEEDAEFLARITVEFSPNFSYPPAGDATGYALFKAVYSDVSIGFIAEQVQEFAKDWANFSKGSAKS